jgi:hypothetical protein
MNKKIKLLSSMIPKLNRKNNKQIMKEKYFPKLNRNKNN